MPPRRYQSAIVDPAPLAQPLHFVFSGRTAKNRILKGPTTEHLASWDRHDAALRGIPSLGLINLYRRWGEGGFGQIVTGNIMIDAEHLEERGNMVIPGDAAFAGPRFDAFRALGAAGSAHGSLMVGQLNHPGRLAYSGLQQHPVSASAVPITPKLDTAEDKELAGAFFTYAPPHAASQAEIDAIVAGFAHAAEFLNRAGWDGVELNAAHGFLLSQFLSSVSNQRSDGYGGSLEKRMQLLIDVAAEIRRRVSPTFVLGVKINSVDFQDGFSPTDAGRLCQALEAASFDYVVLSGGSVETGYAELSGVKEQRRASTERRESFFLEFADQIVAPLSKTRSYVIGGFKTVAGMVDALKSVDGVGLVRAVCQEPCLPLDILSGRVNAGIKRLLADQNFAITTCAAGTQMRQISKDQMPFDQSDQTSVDSFLADFNAYMASYGKQEDKYGFLDLTQPARPYRVVRP